MQPNHLLQNQKVLLKNIKFQLLRHQAQTKSKPKEGIIAIIALTPKQNIQTQELHHQIKKVFMLWKRLLLKLLLPIIEEVIVQEVVLLDLLKEENMNLLLIKNQNLVLYPVKRILWDLSYLNLEAWAQCQIIMASNNLLSLRPLNMKKQSLCINNSNQDTLPNLRSKIVDSLTPLPPSLIMKTKELHNRAQLQIYMHNKINYNRDSTLLCSITITILNQKSHLAIKILQRLMCSHLPILTQPILQWDIKQ